jgi:hypothetical protein
VVVVVVDAVVASFTLGNRLKLTGTFTDASAALVDPGTVTCKVIAPDGSVVTVSNTKRSTGIYDAQYTPTRPGTFTFRYVGTNPAIAAGELPFVMLPSKFYEQGAA